MSTVGKQIKVEMEFDGKQVEELYDRVLVAVGRAPNSADLGLENTKVTLDDKGFVKVNDQQQTSDPHIYAIGDIAGGIMLAHKAHKEGAHRRRESSTARAPRLRTSSFRPWCSPIRNWRGAA